MIQRRIMLGLGISLFLVGVVGFAFLLQHWMDVDRCLDAGGSYNYAQSLCDFKDSHPAQGLLGSASAVMAILGMGLGAGLITGANVRKHAL